MSTIFGSGSRFVSRLSIFGRFAGPIAVLFAVIMIVLVAGGVCIGDYSVKDAQYGQGDQSNSAPRCKQRGIR